MEASDLILFGGRAPRLPAFLLAAKASQVTIVSLPGTSRWPETGGEQGLTLTGLASLPEPGARIEGCTSQTRTTQLLTAGADHTYEKQTKSCFLRRQSEPWKRYGLPKGSLQTRPGDNTSG